ncbi:MAG: hypothetical protein EOP10_01910 [Proteobacteria bacterium]|nr:MAG: hypothetical protein EOP10_01910 [Pseudomonadota bacterium]
MRVIGLFTLSIFVSTLAYAQADSDSDSDTNSETESQAHELRTKTGKIIRPVEETFVREGSSEHKRDDLSGEILLDALGFSPYATTGLYAGYYVDPNQVFTLRLNKSEVADDDLKVQTLSVGWKSFWANSFFTHIGASARRFDWNWKVSRYDVSTGNYLTPEHLTSEYYTLTADFAIGNQWQLGNFTIGTEWVGITVPISTLGDDSVSGATAQTFSYDLNSARDDVTLSKRAQLIALRFYLGFAF